MFFVTVHPDRLAPQVIDSVDLAVAMGQEPLSTLQSLAAHRSRGMTRVSDRALKPGEALFWRSADDLPPATLLMAVPRAERQRPPFTEPPTENVQRLNRADVTGPGPVTSGGRTTRGRSSDPQA